MFRGKVWRTDAVCRQRSRPRLEELEARITPYNATTNVWPHPELITISFVPDGTTIAYNAQGQPIQSTLFQDFNAKWSQAVWQKQIELAAQVWAQATNINFKVVTDSGVQFGQITGNPYQQGDPTIGDIRIGGFGDTGSYLAKAYQPPPINNYSIAGDVWFNTDQPFNVGSTFDLFTVAAHEFGHSLGLDHSSDTTAIMATSYPGTKTALGSDDAAGIRSKYSGGANRAADAFDAILSNGTFLTSSLFVVNPVTLTAQLTGLDITTTTDNDYYKFVAPVGSSTLNLSIQSYGLSLLAPRVYVYNAAQALIGFKSGAGSYGTTLSLTVNNLVPGAIYYIKVNGAEATALGTGKYALSLSTGPNSVPTVTLPNTQTAIGNPISNGGSQAEAPSDTYETGTADESITGQQSDSDSEATGVIYLDSDHMLGDEAWVRHRAKPAMAGPHQKDDADRFWQSFAGEEADESEATDVVVLFARGADKNR